MPTLGDGDRVIVSVNGQSSRSGDLVITTSEEHSEDYLVKRRGQDRGGEIILLSDDLLHNNPLTFPSDKVEIRGPVIQVTRTPTRRSPLVRYFRAHPDEYAAALARVESLAQLDDALHQGGAASGRQVHQAPTGEAAGAPA